jgi:uncharacterized protein with HEPN domain
VRLTHIVEAAALIERAIARREREELAGDEITLLAIVKCLENIGEAARQLSDDARRRLPDIPWPKVIGMRNHLVHVYFDIDADVVWATASASVPELAAAIVRALASDTSD